MLILTELFFKRFCAACLTLILVTVLFFFANYQQNFQKRNSIRDVSQTLTTCIDYQRNLSLGV